MNHKYLESSQLYIVLLCLILACNNQTPKTPNLKGFVYSDSELLNERNTGLKAVKVESEKFELKVDSVIKSKFKDAQIIDLVMYHPVTSDKSGDVKKAFIDSNLVGSEVIFHIKQDTMKWEIMFEGDKKIYDYNLNY